MCDGDTWQAIARQLRREATQEAVVAMRAGELADQRTAVAADGSARALLAMARVLERIGKEAGEGKAVAP